MFLFFFSLSHNQRNQSGSCRTVVTFPSSNERKLVARSEEARGLSKGSLTFGRHVFCKPAGHFVSENHIIVMGAKVSHRQMFFSIKNVFAFTFAFVSSQLFLYFKFPLLKALYNLIINVAWKLITTNYKV